MVKVCAGLAQLAVALDILRRKVTLHIGNDNEEDALLMP